VSSHGVCFLFYVGITRFISISVFGLMIVRDRKHFVGYHDVASIPELHGQGGFCILLYNYF
jgi:hypothetical protein